MLHEQTNLGYTQYLFPYASPTRRRRGSRKKNRAKVLLGRMTKQHIAWGDAHRKPVIPVGPEQVAIHVGR